MIITLHSVSNTVRHNKNRTKHFKCFFLRPPQLLAIFNAYLKWIYSKCTTSHYHSISLLSVTQIPLLEEIGYIFVSKLKWCPIRIFTRLSMHQIVKRIWSFLHFLFSFHVDIFLKIDSVHYRDASLHYLVSVDSFFQAKKTAFIDVKINSHRIYYVLINFTHNEYFIELNGRWEWRKNALHIDSTTKLINRLTNVINFICVVVFLHFILCSYVLFGIK